MMTVYLPWILFFTLTVIAASGTSLTNAIERITQRLRSQTQHN